jgi:hypothetical protein
MTIKLDTSGKKYIRFLTWATVWLRDTKANPGTAINGVPQQDWTDIGLRQNVSTFLWCPNLSAPQ